MKAWLNTIDGSIVYGNIDADRPYGSYWTELPDRPSPLHKWVDEQWVFDAKVSAQSSINQIEAAGPQIPRRVWRDLIAGMVKSGLLAPDLPIVLEVVAEEAAIAPFREALK